MNRRGLMQAASLAALTPALARAQAGRPGIIRSFEDAEAAFVFGLPVVMNYAVM